MYILNPAGDKALNTKEFIYAYVKNNDMAGITDLRVMLHDENEVYWDSIPGHCAEAIKDMIDSLAVLVAQMSDIPILINSNQTQALNVKEFCSATVRNCKESYSTRIMVTLREVTNVNWMEIPYDDDASEEEMRKELSELTRKLNKLVDI